jgi:hypothetical protein
MYLQRRRKVFLFIFFQVKLLTIHTHGDITSNVSSSYLGISKCSTPATHFPVKLGPVYGFRIRLIFQTQTSLQYCPARAQCSVRLTDDGRREFSKWEGLNLRIGVYGL